MLTFGHAVLELETLGYHLNLSPYHNYHDQISRLTETCLHSAIPILALVARSRYLDLFERCKTGAFLQYCAICRRGPYPGAKDYDESTREEYAHASLGPTDRQYWELCTRMDIGHGIKYPYSLCALMDTATVECQRRDEEGQSTADRGNTSGGHATSTRGLKEMCLQHWWRLSPL
jgi:hypothetical protein